MFGDCLVVFPYLVALFCVLRFLVVLVVCVFCLTSAHYSACLCLLLTRGIVIKVVDPASSHTRGISFYTPRLGERN